MRVDENLEVRVLTTPQRYSDKVGKGVSAFKPKLASIDLQSFLLPCLLNDVPIAKGMASMPRASIEYWNSRVNAKVSLIL